MRRPVSSIPRTTSFSVTVGHRSSEDLSYSSKIDLTMSHYGLDRIARLSTRDTSSKLVVVMPASAMLCTAMRKMATSSP